jgi:hypothetical protein
MHGGSYSTIVSTLISVNDWLRTATNLIDFRFLRTAHYQRMILYQRAYHYNLNATQEPHEFRSSLLRNGETSLSAVQYARADTDSDHH